MELQVYKMMMKMMQMLEQQLNQCEKLKKIAKALKNYLTLKIVKMQSSNKRNTYAYIGKKKMFKRQNGRWRHAV